MQKEIIESESIKSINLKYPSQVFRTPEDVVSKIKLILDSESKHQRDKEHFWVIGLDTKKRAKFLDLIALGTLNECIIHPREVFRLSIMHGVDSIILIHNHPSGDASPSRSDYEITDRLKNCGDLIGIQLIDHIIVGDNFFSFASNGLLK